MLDPRRMGLLTVVMLVMMSDSPLRAASPQELSNWAQWRGPLMTGEAPAGDPPTTWSEEKNIRWKIKLPGHGTATPIVWGDSIFIQTAIALSEVSASAAAPAGAGPASQPSRPRGDRIVSPTEPYQFVVMCLDRRTGNTIWQKVARQEIPHEGHHPDHGFASSSPVTDGQHLYAYFGSRGLHCYDMQGNLQWEKDLGKMQTRKSFGEGSSPALFGDTLVITWDHMADDFIVAFDKRTGNELWRQPRDEDQTWATPLVVEYDGKPQVVAVGQKKVRSYDLQTGNQVWEAPGLTVNPIPTPVYGNGMVYATSGFKGAELMAIRLGSSGDLTGTPAIVWSAKKATPYVPSPLLYGQRLYLFSGNNPVLTCFDALSGKMIVEMQQIAGLKGVYASPVAAAGRVYLVGRNGTTVVIRQVDQSSKVEVLSTNVLNDRIDASPVIVGKDLLLRGHEYLYCVGEGS